MAVPPGTVVPLGLALVLERARPWPRTWPGRHVPVGVLLVAAGVTVNGWASLTARGRVDDLGELRSTGPYAVSRHPMYVGWHLVHLGLVLASPSVWSLLGLAAGLAVGHRTVLAEEGELDVHFGVAYEGYRQQVRRYL